MNIVYNNFYLVLLLTIITDKICNKKHYCLNNNVKINHLFLS